MPLSRYNPEFGGEKGSAAKAHAAMKEQYGEKKGKSVFYALINKRKSEAGTKELARGKSKKR